MEIAQPLYELTKGGLTMVEWTAETEGEFRELQTALLSAPALSIPDVTKPFHLYVDEKAGVAEGVLTQTLGPWQSLASYLSKKLDPVAAGFPPCLHIIAAMALLVRMQVYLQKLTKLDYEGDWAKTRTGKLILP